MSWTKLAVIGLVILFAIVLWLSHEVWAAAFLGVLLALSLTGPALWMRQYVRMPAWLATLVVLLIVLAVLGGLGWLVGSPLTSQVQDMIAKLPNGTEKAVDWLDQRAWGRVVLQQIGDWTGMSQEQMRDVDEFFAVDTNDQTASESQPLWPDQQGRDQQGTSETDTTTSDSSAAMDASQILGFFSDAVSATLQAAALVLVSFVVALFLAFDPSLYERGVLWLVPKRHEAVARKTMRRLARGLRWWMLGRLASMTAVAILTSLGMWAIGMPAPMALGVLAGLLSFVPNIGPIVSAVPGLILAVPLGPWMILGAASVYLGAQLIESNALNPLIAQYAVSVPPGLLIVTQFILAALGGIWALIVATPLLVVVMILVQQLYVRETLDEPIHVTGSRSD